MIAALYVEKGGTYFNLENVEPWDIDKDARQYEGPWPVVAHPPCERWGRFWHGSPRKPHQFKLGDDGGCFEAALYAVRRWGGVLEHPADSHAWRAFGLNRPAKSGGWIKADQFSGLTCYVEQGHYGHQARKATWLYACGFEPPELKWGQLPQRLDPKMVERHGYEYARRKGLVSMIGGKHKKAIRNATPIEFRNLLISLAEVANNTRCIDAEAVLRQDGAQGFDGVIQAEAVGQGAISLKERQTLGAISAAANEANSTNRQSRDGNRVGTQGGDGNALAHKA